MTLTELNPQIRAVLDTELERQRTTLEMVTSENLVPRTVFRTQGSVLANKYTEGYPSRRCYGDCEAVDVTESLAIERTKQVFTGVDFVNVQPHAGTQTNAAAFATMTNVGNTILGLPLVHDGHLTYDMKVDFSDKSHHAVVYEISPETMRIEPERIHEATLRERSKVIVTGWSAYLRYPGFRVFREIADKVGAVLWVDMAHFTGLAAAGLHPTPIPRADVVTATVHKILGSPRSGMILSSRGEQWSKKISSVVFPDQQGGPIIHAIAAEVIAMKVVRTEKSEDRQCRTLEGVQILTERPKADDAKGAGITLVTGGTDVHLVLVDPVNPKLDGQQAKDPLHEVRIIVDRNAIPFDPRPPKVTSGLRIGTPALAAHSFDAKDFAEVAGIIGATLAQGASGASIDADGLRVRVEALASTYPLYAGLDE